jgi:hypothetical protein
MKNEQSKVVEATVLGQNCGACRWIFVYVRGINGITTTIPECSFHIGVSWAHSLKPREDTEHPPGRSVCPHFEEQE